MIIKFNDRLVLHTTINKCYTKLSIGGEDSGHSEIYLIYLHDKELVSFRYHLLWHYEPVKLGLDGFDLIFTNLSIKDLINLLRVEFYELIIENYKILQSNIIIDIIEKFINYISKEENSKYIIYKI